MRSSLLTLPDETQHNGPFAAQVHFVPKLPTLAIEEVESHLYDVVCTESTVELIFSTQELWEEALVEFTTPSQFMLVTSHAGCNEEGERNIYR